MNADFEAMYDRHAGRESIPPEQLLRGLLIQMLFTVRSERQLMERKPPPTHTPKHPANLLTRPVWHKVLRQQRINVFIFMRWQTRQNIFQIGKGLDAVGFCCRHQTHNRRCPLPG